MKKEPDFLSIMKNELIKKKNEIIKESKEEFGKHIKGEFREVESAGEDGNSVRDASADISLELLGKNKRIIIDINEALIKIEKGTYGICAECEEQIPKGRLLANPSATLCVQCQEEKELADKRDNY
jgi:DnaK suppressor protein